MSRSISILLAFSLALGGALTPALAQDVDGQPGGVAPAKAGSQLDQWRDLGRAAGEAPGETRRWVEQVGPLARAIGREGDRLALAPQGRSADADWSRVRKLEPGSDITMNVRGLQPGRRILVTADDSGITVLNLSDPNLPVAAVRALREIASQHPDYIEGALAGATFLLDNVRLTSARVFVADGQVAELQHVVEIVSRTDVAQITTLQRGRGVWGHLGLLGGYFVGAMSGGFVGDFGCRAVGRKRCDTQAFLRGSVVGAVAGAVHGFRAANRETENVVYRAP
jgi:hypothetical protein